MTAVGWTGCTCCACGSPGSAIVAMSLVIPWGVFARYVLGSGSQWPEPVAIMLMTVFTFFGAAVTYRAAGHIAVETLTQAVPPRWRRSWRSSSTC